MLDLLLCRPAPAHNRLFDLQCAVFLYIQSMIDSRDDRRASCLPQGQSRLRIACHEYLFNRHYLRLGSFNHLGQPLENLM